MGFKHVGIILGASALSFGLFSANVNATTTLNEQLPVQIKAASTENVFTKEDLIKKFRGLFPKQFDFLTNADFQMNGGYYYPGEETMRYDLYFTKTINGKQLYGNVSFVGKDLQIENFSYQPATVTDALFPAKVSKEEAQKIAGDFMKKYLQGGEYQLETDTYGYYPTQLLTEPIRYSFSYTRLKNKVSIADQRIEVSVLGNGEIVGFYRNLDANKASTFDDVKKAQAKDTILKKVKENLYVEKQYQIETDNQTGKRHVRLVYQPSPNFLGVHASSGKYLTLNGYSTTFPKKSNIAMLASKPLPTKNEGGTTMEEAKKIAEKLLKVDLKDVKLNIDSIREIDNYNGQEVISIQYMYSFPNGGGTGASLEINKQTGEVIQYHNMKSQILEQLGEKPSEVKPLSEKQALEKAIDYIKKWVPSYLHNYAKPIEAAYLDEMQGGYMFNFPRVANGVIVSGDYISVGVTKDGSLNNLYVNYQEVENWPSPEKAISEKEAKNILNKALSLKLNYMMTDHKQDNNHYDLVYSPLFNDKSFSSLDAITGEWQSLYGENTSTQVSHPWAEDELNYLISTKVLDIKDPKKFDGDASISKGEALKVIMKSLTYMYDGYYYPEQENQKQTFENIDPAHPLYQSVERAVEMGVIKPDTKNFAIDESISKEQLAVWYIRALGLEQAAENSTIYKLPFKDADKVQKELLGYVALANSTALLEADEGTFNPKKEVTYAELAVSTIRLAHKISEKGRTFLY
ncbi:YcdB/YcdC domain-containing protein [Psychrobacillus psychrodurans]|uniref:YcdB/YcdC domain-containing protein n=1 Tax=Psychrobacillus psychrodurans TaxID=126157 RepID=UPI0008E181F5|nr:YcdB/YcdC domain-containing protein [Psychrobacillus psychrodurans]MCZ8541441.1 S-layer homology domain-containing protein [Psychrobacillus psychrodurans]SFM98626.1 S-layer homology domain-containing protein [Psychrobacillus psychrodurans]